MPAIDAHHSIRNVFIAHAGNKILCPVCTSNNQSEHTHIQFECTQIQFQQAFSPDRLNFMKRILYT